MDKVNGATCKTVIQDESSVLNETSAGEHLDKSSKISKNREVKISPEDIEDIKKNTAKNCGLPGWAFIGVDYASNPNLNKYNAAVAKEDNRICEAITRPLLSAVEQCDRLFKQVDWKDEEIKNLNLELTTKCLIIAELESLIFSIYAQYGDSDMVMQATKVAEAIKRAMDDAKKI